jgi:hypothetical protein
MATPDVDRTQVAVVRDEAFFALRAALPAANLEAATRCSARLLDELPNTDQLDRNLVLVAYGGGKDSSYTLAFVRTMQLILFRLHGTTFRLRVATNRHAGMPRAVMENIDRAYQALRLPEDPDCELLLIDGNEVSTFDVDAPQRPEVVRRNRLDILMAGHRTLADGRPTFCNACNLSVVNSFGLAASFGGGADLIITGDSKEEQRQYTAWVGRLARQLAPASRSTEGNGIGRILAQVDGISQAYFTEIHGEEAVEAVAERRVAADVPERLRFFSIYSDTEYAAGAHMEILTGLLGFRFDDIAFNFTESDCGNPALMAHLRGLKCDKVLPALVRRGAGRVRRLRAGADAQEGHPGRPDRADAEALRRTGGGGRDAQGRQRLRDGDVRADRGAADLHGVLAVRGPRFLARGVPGARAPGGGLPDPRHPRAAVRRGRGRRVPDRRPGAHERAAGARAPGALPQHHRPVRCHPQQHQPGQQP